MIYEGYDLYGLSLLSKDEAKTYPPLPKDVAEEDVVDAVDDEEE